MILEVIILGVMALPLLLLTHWGIQNHKVGQYGYECRKVVRECCRNKTDLLRLIKQKEGERCNTEIELVRRPSI
jgi:hypothetical protein